MPLLVAALTDHKAHAKVCANASYALWAIASGSAARAAVVRAAGAVPLLVAVSRDHKGDAQRRAKWALRSLGLSPDGQPL